jgi:hypothetical protein
MSEIGVAEIAVVLNRDDSVLPRITAPAKNPLLEGPILPTLLRLTAPNVVALSAGTCVAVAETSYIGRLGTEALAAIALVFPFVILTMTMSGGAMGGGVSSAIARALGAEDTHRASTLAAHALLIGGCFGIFFTVSMIVFGATLLEALGGRGSVLAQAVGYTEIFFGAALIPWLMNTLASILRGTGNMRLPSTVILCSAACSGWVSGRCRSSACAASPPERSSPIRSVRRSWPGMCFQATPASIRWFVDFASSARCSSIFSRSAPSPVSRRCSRC